ncbi:hypothetical protein T02_13308 [Trichinella nativa]|uniref:Secreted protein n=1 Tax=Trichinella nativa TaxID=6335 RepID=A0A0V1LF37_9BILA|nr:hypothetical protein T02_13308 [Trichinella nativa]
MRFAVGWGIVTLLSTVGRSRVRIKNCPSRGECQALGAVHSSFQWTGVQVTVVELHHWHHSPPNVGQLRSAGCVTCGIKCHAHLSTPAGREQSNRNLGALVRRQIPLSHSTIRTPTIRNIIDDIQQADRGASELKINQTQNGELFRP